ncbi:17226_t:CDS:2, partial [Acaulospora morrowiae]
MLLIGIVLAPIFIRSRRLAQQPKWKNRRARASHNGRKWTAFAIYGGTALTVGFIGHWMNFYLPMNPYLWWVSVEPDFMHLAFSVAFSVLIYLEYLRYFAVFPFGKKLHIFLCEFLDSRDVGPCIVSHIYLLFGCAACVWMQGNSMLANLSGILTLGIGDAMASIIGKRCGRRRWPGTSKTVEGSVSFVLFQLFGAYAITRIYPLNNMWAGDVKWVGYSFALSATGKYLLSA